MVERGRAHGRGPWCRGFGLERLGLRGFHAAQRRSLPHARGHPSSFEEPRRRRCPHREWATASRPGRAQAADAVATLIRERKLKRPILVGHSFNGSQVVMRRRRSPGAGSRGRCSSPARAAVSEPVEAGGQWPKNLTLEKKIQMTDQYMAPRWFKTVTRDTWVTNNFKADDYSTDSKRGAALRRPGQRAAAAGSRVAALCSSTP